MSRNKRGKKKKGDRVRSKETEKNQDVWGQNTISGRTFKAYLMMLLSSFIYTLPLCKELRMRYQNQHFCHSQSNEILIELRVGVKTEQLLITGMYRTGNLVLCKREK